MFFQGQFWRANISVSFLKLLQIPFLLLEALKNNSNSHILLNDPKKPAGQTELAKIHWYWSSIIKNTPVVLVVCQKGLYFGFSFSLPQTEAQPETVTAWKNLQIKYTQIILDREIFNPILNMKNWSRHKQAISQCFSRNVWQILWWNLPLTNLQFTSFNMMK